MIILRNTQEEREFSSLADNDKKLIHHGTAFLKEIMKYLLMCDSPLVGEWTLNHWMDISVVQFASVGPEEAIKLFLGLVDNYKNLPRKRYTEDFAIQMREGKRTGSDYIDFIKDSIKSDKRCGEVKYDQALLSAPNYSNEDLIQIYKFIALCLTGQLNPQHDNWYDSKIKSMQVDWSKRINIEKDNLREIIKSITYK